MTNDRPKCPSFFFNSYGSPSALKALTIHVGTNLLSETGTVYKAKQVIPHKDFNPSRLVNDIGLIILSTPIEYAEKVQPVVFASSTELAPAGSACVLSGWGRLRVSVKKLFYAINTVSSLSNIYRILFMMCSENISKIYYYSLDIDSKK